MAPKLSESGSVRPKAPPVVISRADQVRGGLDYQKGYQEGLKMARRGHEAEYPQSMDTMSSYQIGVVAGLQRAEVDSVVRKATQTPPINPASLPQSGDATSNYLEQMRARRRAEEDVADISDLSKMTVDQTPEEKARALVDRFIAGVRRLFDGVGTT